MINDLVRIHHENYLDDIKYWQSRTREGNPILELGCGHGRVTIPLLKAGKQVVGLDLDLESLSFLINASQEDGFRNPHLVQADMLFPPLRTGFGSVIIPCNTYSIFKVQEKTHLLHNINRLLQPSGSLFISVPNPHLIQKYHQDLIMNPEDNIPETEDMFIHPSTGNPIQVSSRMDPLPDALIWEWIYDELHPDGSVERQKQSVIHQLNTLAQYRDELEKACFQENKILGDFDESLYQDDSPYLIMECIKF